MASIEIIAAIRLMSARCRERGCTRIARVEAVDVIWKLCPKNRNQCGTRPIACPRRDIRAIQILAQPSLRAQVGCQENSRVGSRRQASRPSREKMRKRNEAVTACQASLQLLAGNPVAGGVNLPQYVRILNSTEVKGNQWLSDFIGLRGLRGNSTRPTGIIEQGMKQRQLSWNQATELARRSFGRHVTLPWLRV
jgi:hypothetical protein